METKLYSDTDVTQKKKLWSRSEEEQTVDSFKFLRPHFLADHFWTSFFSHKLHRGGYEETSLPLLKDTHQDPVSGKRRMTRLGRTWTLLTHTKGLKKLLKLTIKASNPHHDVPSAVHTLNI